MATASPAVSNNSADNTTSITGGATTSSGGGRSITAAMGPMSINNNNSNSKTLRGLNKPKCIKCGNVARSRCPYHSCKNCCAKAQNPCVIHVLKSSTPVPDKSPSAGSSVTEQHASETPSSGNAHRVTSLRQLSSNFAQFNNLQTPTRPRKPLTRKEAYQLNEWRFSKLKEYKDRNIEIENEAFDRYLQNISLLEEVFAVSSKLGEPVSTVDEIERKTETMVSNLKLKLTADPIRIENFRDRMRFIVHNGLRKLKSETPTGNEEPTPGNKSKKARYSSLVELNKKLSNARTDEDLKSCHLLKTQIFNRHEQTSGEEAEDLVDGQPKQTSGEEAEDLVDGQPKQKSGCSTLKWFSTCTVDQEALSHIDTQFSSIQEMEQL